MSDEIVADDKVRQKYAEDEFSLLVWTVVSVKTRSPDKWRFLDLETGGTWKWSQEKKGLLKSTSS